MSRAAALRHEDLTGFILRMVLPAAEKIIEQAERIELSRRKRHRRAEFDCGEPALNDYLARFAVQAHERGGAKAFVTR